MSNAGGYKDSPVFTLHVTPLPVLPQTGDAGCPALWGALMACRLISLGSMARRHRTN